MRVKTHVRAGALSVNHNETLMRDAGKVKVLKVKTHVRAGVVAMNHNVTLVADTRRRR